MKLDLDCIKDVMVFLEDNLTDDNAFVPNQIYESLEKYSYEDVEYTVKALLSEKWIAGIVQEIGGLYIVKSITPDGHNYLNAIKDESIYKIIKKHFATAGTSTLSFLTVIIKDVLVKYTDKHDAVSVALHYFKNLF